MHGNAAPQDWQAEVAVDAIFRPVRLGNAFEETVERLLQAIRLGVIPFGSRLPSERELAVRLGISRMTLREAMKALQQAGYVEARQGRTGGTFVLYRPELPRRGDLERAVEKMSGDLRDTLTYRLVLETGAAATAAVRPLDPGEEKALRLRLAEVDGASPERYRAMDTLFHLYIADLAGSRSLSAAVADCRMRMNDLLNAIPMLEINITHARDQHAAVVDAILAGDPGRARDAMSEHLEGTAALLRGFLD